MTELSSMARPDRRGGRAGTPRPHTFLFSVESAVCKDSYRGKCRLLSSLSTLTSVRLLTDSVLQRENMGSQLTVWAIFWATGRFFLLVEHGRIQNTAVFSELYQPVCKNHPLARVCRQTVNWTPKRTWAPNTGTAATPSPRTFIFSVEVAVCEDSHRRQCRRNRLLGSLPTLTSVRILTDSNL